MVVSYPGVGAVSDPRTPRVLLLTLSRRTSAKGNEYWAGWLGKASVVGFPGAADKYGNETVDLFVSPAPPRQHPPPAQRGAWGDGPAAGDRTADFLYEDGGRAHAREGSR